MKKMKSLQIGEKYQKEEVCKYFGKTKYNPYIGLVQSDNIWMLFFYIHKENTKKKNVPYPNYFLNDDIVWFSQNQHSQKSSQILSILDDKTEKHLFYRYKKKESFIYWGVGIVKEYQGENPVKFIFEQKEKQKVKKKEEQKGKTEGKTKQSKGFVYYIQEGMTGNIKIGYSTDPYQRLRQHQTSNSQSLRMLLYVLGNEEYENELQTRFEHLKTTGEWFKSEDDIIKHIEDERLRMFEQIHKLNDKYELLKKRIELLENN